MTAKASEWLTGDHKGRFRQTNPNRLSNEDPKFIGHAQGCRGSSGRKLSFLITSNWFEIDCIIMYFSRVWLAHDWSWKKANGSEELLSKDDEPKSLGRPVDLDPQRTAWDLGQWMLEAPSAGEAKTHFQTEVSMSHEGKGFDENWVRIYHRNGPLCKIKLMKRPTLQILESKWREILTRQLSLSILQVWFEYIQSLALLLFLLWWYLDVILRNTRKSNLLLHFPAPPGRTSLLHSVHQDLLPSPEGPQCQG